jgi:hypothetical protein
MVMLTPDPSWVMVTLVPPLETWMFCPFCEMLTLDPSLETCTPPPLLPLPGTAPHDCTVWLTLLLEPPPTEIWVVWSLLTQDEQEPLVEVMVVCWLLDEPELDWLLCVTWTLLWHPLLGRCVVFFVARTCMRTWLAWLLWLALAGAAV